MQSLNFPFSYVCTKISDTILYNKNISIIIASIVLSIFSKALNSKSLIREGYSKKSLHFISNVHIIYVDKNSSLVFNDYHSKINDEMYYLP